MKYLKRYPTMSTETKKKKDRQRRAANEGRANQLYLKYGWTVENLNDNYHMRITIPCEGGKVRFDYWPTTGKISRTGSGNIELDGLSLEGYIFKYLLVKGYKPIFN